MQLQNVFHQNTSFTNDCLKQEIHGKRLRLANDSYNFFIRTENALLPNCSCVSNYKQFIELNKLKLA